MTLKQLQKYIVGVLQGWMPNKSILDKFSETADGKLLFNGIEIGSGGSFVTDEEVTQNITDTLQQLKLQLLTKDDIVKAKLNESAECEHYAITFDDISTSTVNTINVTATGLTKHVNDFGMEGLWAGVTIFAPEGTKGVKFIFQNDSITTSLDDVAAVELTDGRINFYTNKMDKNPKDNIAVQFFVDKECTKAITPEYRFEMILDITEA